jgi:hypothetical protein
VEAQIHDHFKFECEPAPPLAQLADPRGFQQIKELGSAKA